MKRLGDLAVFVLLLTNVGLYLWIGLRVFERNEDDKLSPFLALSGMMLTMAIAVAMRYTRSPDAKDREAERDGEEKRDSYD